MQKTLRQGILCRPSGKLASQHAYRITIVMHKSTGQQRTTDAHIEECQIGLYRMYLQVKIVYGLPPAADIDNRAYKVGEVSMIIKRDYTIRN